MRRFAVFAFLLALIGGVAVFARTVLMQPDPVILSNAQAVPDPDTAGAVRIYLTMENRGAPNRLISATTPDADFVEISGGVTGDVVLPSGSTPSFSPDGVFLLLTGFSGDLEPGRFVPITLEFEPSGISRTRALIGATPDLHSMTMDEAMIDPPDGPPELSIAVSADGGDWAVTLQTDGFMFVPEMQEPVHVPGEGHGHIYLNGLKLGRVYDHRVTFGTLPPGEYTVTVTLNSNDHFAYEDENGPVFASAEIVVD